MGQHLLYFELKSFVPSLFPWKQFTKKSLREQSVVHKVGIMQVTYIQTENRICFYLVPGNLRLQPLSGGFKPSSITGKHHLEWITSITIDLPPDSSSSSFRAASGISHPVLLLYSGCHRAPVWAIRAESWRNRPVLLTFQFNSWVYLSQVSYDIHNTFCFQQFPSFSQHWFCSNPSLPLIYRFTYLEVYSYRQIFLASLQAPLLVWLTKFMLWSFCQVQLRDIRGCETPNYPTCNYHCEFHVPEFHGHAVLYSGSDRSNSSGCARLLIPKMQINEQDFFMYIMDFYTIFWTNVMKYLDLSGI